MHQKADQGTSFSYWLGYASEWCIPILRSRSITERTFWFSRWRRFFLSGVAGFTSLLFLCLLHDYLFSVVTKPAWLSAAGHVVRAPIQQATKVDITRSVADRNNSNLSTWKTNHNLARVDKLVFVGSTYALFLLSRPTCSSVCSFVFPHWYWPYQIGRPTVGSHERVNRLTKALSIFKKY